MSKIKVSKVKAVAGAIAASTAILAGAAFAGPTPVLHNPDNAAGTFTNFDWSSNGTAFTSNGFVPQAGNMFTLTYFANANSIYGGSVVYPRLDGNPNAAVAGSLYEYTIVATLNETVQSCTLTSCVFITNGGNFNVYYDQNPLTFANNALGTGFSDGILQISASVMGGTSATFDTVSGINVTGVQALITYTDTNPLDASYITPALTSSNTVTTLQIGAGQTATPAGGYNGTAFTGSSNCGGAVCGQIVFQADGNSAFAVPEPGSLALFGVGVTALGLRYRRRKAAA